MRPGFFRGSESLALSEGIVLPELSMADASHVINEL